jgi:hypothetical protein
MIFLKATAIPKNMQTNRSAGEVPNSRSNNQPTSAPPAGPAISSVKTRFPCRIPLAGTWSEPERIASALRAAFSCMSNESSRASLLPFVSCPGLSETMRFILLNKGNRHKIGATPPRHGRFRRALASSQQRGHDNVAVQKKRANTSLHRPFHDCSQSYYGQRGSSCGGLASRVSHWPEGV